jgi:hypothetical protein
MNGTNTLLLIKLMAQYYGVMFKPNLYRFVAGVED